jgi:MinD-like ATPase involved in chromosome partitioning or flagellar assembly
MSGKYNVDVGSDLERPTLREVNEAGEERIIAVFVGVSDISDALKLKKILDNATSREDS